MPAKISVVIVNYRVKWFLAQTLASVKEAMTDIDHEVWVIDNRSCDDSIAYAKRLFPEYNYIENRENVGFARANNQAIMQAAGEYTLILNPDTIITGEAVRLAIAKLDSDEHCGAVGTRMIDGDGRFLPESKRSFPTPWVSFCKIFGLAKLFPKSRIFGRYALQYLSEEMEHQVDILAGAYILARTTVLKQIGGFDEAFFMYGEDIDLSYRITQQGYHNIYLPTPIIHYKGESTHKDDFRYVTVFYEAMLIFFKKHYPHLSLPFHAFIKSGIAVRAAIAMAKRGVLKLLPVKATTTVDMESRAILDTDAMNYAEIVAAIARSRSTGTLYGIRSNVCENRIITPKMPQQ